ncbi:TetR/AcrR family transcriptional regulator [Gordonia sp. VNK21]|uniref:TetR/AcrR family transcriptional regulator n=1 Tax=Gordonia sp. VNK21 TaxID=3382483 RepID=UPI0038D44354
MSSASPRRRMSYDERHRQLLDVAEKLFIERAYALVSMEDIARAADVTRPVVYNHFTTKEGAYIACIRRNYEVYNAALLQTIDPDAPAVDQLRAGAEFYFSSITHNTDRWLMLFTSASVLTGEHQKELTALRFEHIEVIADLLRRSAPAAPGERIEATAHAVSGVGERLGHWWLTRPDMSLDTIVDHFVSILMGDLTRWIDH